MSFPRPFLKYALLCIIGAIVLSACAPSNATPAMTAVPTRAAPSSPVPTTPPPTLTAIPENCQIIAEAKICVDDITRSSFNTRVKLKILVESFRTGVDMYSDDSSGLSFVLLDEQGRSYAVIDPGTRDVYNEAERSYGRELSFEPVPADVKELTISLPIVEVNSSFGGRNEPPPLPGIQIDLGEHPQPGETKALDVSMTAAGQTFHFVKATFEGDGVNSLTLTLFTDPLSLPDELYAVKPMLANREKEMALFGEKHGTSGVPFEAYFELVVPPGKSSGLTQNTYITGVLDLQIYDLAVAYRGPFKLRYKFP